MKIAVTDACIFIDLYELQLTTKFFGLELEIHTTVDVFNELNPEQKELLLAFQSIGKLVLHNILSEDRLAIGSIPYPKGLSPSDRTVLFIAETHNAMVLSSDRTVRQSAKNRKVEYHGMLWIFDKLLESNIIDKEVAFSKLTFLSQNNFFYQNREELVNEIKKRLEMWSN